MLELEVVIHDSTDDCIVNIILMFLADLNVVGSVAKEAFKTGVLTLPTDISRELRLDSIRYGSKEGSRKVVVAEILLYFDNEFDDISRSDVLA